MTSESSKVSGVTKIQSSGVDELYRAIPYIKGTKRRKHLGWFETKEEAEAAVKAYKQETQSQKDLSKLAHNPTEWEKVAKEKIKEITRKYEAKRG